MKVTVESRNANQILRRLSLQKNCGEKNENYLKLLGFPVPDTEPEKELDYEGEEETDI